MIGLSVKKVIFLHKSRPLFKKTIKYRLILNKYIDNNLKSLIILITVNINIYILILTVRTYFRNSTLPGLKECYFPQILFPSSPLGSRSLIGLCA